MKITVLGGAGDMGSGVARDLAAHPDVAELVIADFNEARAKDLAHELGGKVKAVFVDANSDESLRQVIKGNSSVAGCIGPFYRYEVKMASAAIEEKVPYVSLCDDFDAAEAVLALDSKAKEMGATILTGLGWTPGISNVCAKKGCEEMDQVSDIHIAWSGDSDDSEGLAVIKHTYHIFTGTVKTFLEGRWTTIPAGSGREMVEFLPPIGKIPVYHLGHPEPVTIPRFISNLRTVTLKGGLTPTWLNPLAKMLVGIGLTNTAQKKDSLANITKRFTRILSSGGLRISGLRVEVTGKKNGKEVKKVFRCADRMRRLTGIPCAIGAWMLASRQITAQGVLAPEACVDPAVFFKELAKRNVVVHEK